MEKQLIYCTMQHRLHHVQRQREADMLMSVTACFAQCRLARTAMLLCSRLGLLLLDLNGSKALNVRFRLHNMHCHAQNAFRYICHQSCTWQVHNHGHCKVLNGEMNFGCAFSTCCCFSPAVHVWQRSLCQQGSSALTCIGVGRVNVYHHHTACVLSAHELCVPSLHEQPSVQS